MTTELVLLLGLFAFILAGGFFGEKGPFKVFEKSGPRLGARLEQQITIGRGFKVQGGGVRAWEKPGVPAPNGKL
jgi:hypothetical protein